jgi:hypothetical protein
MAEPQLHDAAHRRVFRPGRQRYGFLLLVLVATYTLSAFTHARIIGAVQIALFVATLLLALRGNLAHSRAARLVIAVVLASSAVVLALALAVPGNAVKGTASIWAGLVLLVTVVVIVHGVLSTDVVTVQSIFGAVSAYMITGLMFASWYAAIAHLDHGSFFSGGRPGNIQTFQYFSFTTLTTLGYGDFTAADSGGRAIAVLEALAGQVFLATLVARLVASFRGPQSRVPLDQPTTQEPIINHQPVASHHPATGHQPAARQPAPKLRSALKRHLG